MSKIAISMYEIHCDNKKPKNVFEKILYKIWLFSGVSPSCMLVYLSYKHEKEMLTGDK